MKRYVYLAIIFMSTVQAVFCAVEPVSDDLHTSLKSNAHEPGIMSIIFALVFVIFLIYITGLIYSKLNIVGAKAVKEQLKNYDLNSIMVLSTKQLGPNKNLHVIELNNKRYLIGAAPNSINLLKELEDVPREGLIEEEKSIAENPQVEEFNVHKKYL